MKITLTYPQIDEILKLVNREIKTLENVTDEVKGSFTSTQRIFNITENKQSDEEKRIVFLNNMIDTFKSIVGQVEFEVDVKLGRTEDKIVTEAKMMYLKDSLKTEQVKPVDRALQTEVDNKVEEFK